MSPWASWVGEGVEGDTVAKNKNAGLVVCGIPQKHAMVDHQQLFPGVSAYGALINSEVLENT